MTDPIFTKEDLYAMNRMINKLNDSGYSHDAAKIIEVRDFHFNDDAECVTYSWL